MKLNQTENINYHKIGLHQAETKILSPDFPNRKGYADCRTNINIINLCKTLTDTLQEVLRDLV